MLTHGIIALGIACLAALGPVCCCRHSFVWPISFTLVSEPSLERHVHTKPLPRIGGLAMFVAFVAAVAISFWFPVERFPIEVERIALLLTGAVLIVAVMLVDDVVGVSRGSNLPGRWPERRSSSLHACAANLMDSSSTSSTTPSAASYTFR